MFVNQDAGLPAVSVREFIKHQFRHFNAAVVVDAAEAYERHLAQGGKMFLAMAGAMSTAELGISLAEMIRRGKIHAICTTGASINCLGLLFLSTLNMNTSRLGVILRLIPFGLGMGLFQPPNNSAMMGAVPKNRLGIVSGMISALKNLGSMTGVAVTTAVLAITQFAMLNKLQGLGVASAIAERQSFVAAVRATALLSAGVCAVVVFTSFSRGHRQVDRKDANLAEVES